MTPAAADAWRTILALQHEAVWSCSLVGARVADLRDAARTEWLAHQRSRDRVVAWLTAADEPLVRAREGYDRAVPGSATAARAIVADVERRLVAAAVQLVGVSVDRERRRALDVLGAASEAALRWGAEPQALPGLSAARRPSD